MAGAQGSRRQPVDALEEKLNKWRSKHKPIKLLSTKESDSTYEALEVAAEDLFSVLAGDASRGLSKRHFGVLARDFLLPCTMNILTSKRSAVR